MPVKVLVIRFSSIGDIVLTSPVVRILHEQLGAEVHYLTKPAFASIVINNPYITKVISISKDAGKTIAELKSESYDAIIDLHHNLRSLRIKLALQFQSGSVDKRNFQKWLMVRFKSSRITVPHIVNRYIDAIKFPGIKDDLKGLDFYIAAQDHINVVERYGSAFSSFAAIVIGAAHETKCMTGDQIVALCDVLKMPVILLGGAVEVDKGEYIIANSSNKEVVSDCGKINIHQSASIIQQAATIITHDTGLMHIAAALKKPQVIVWGNTVPEFGMYPYYGDDDIEWKSFEIKDLPCRPCSKLGYNKCPQGHFSCMLNHDLIAIAKAAIGIAGA